MNIQDYILDAINLVSAWDVPNEDFADTVNDQARLMAGTPSATCRSVMNDSAEYALHIIII